MEKNEILTKDLEVFKTLNSRLQNQLTSNIDNSNNKILKESQVSFSLKNKMKL